jgi:hypothetical protein
MLQLHMMQHACLAAATDQQRPASSGVCSDMHVITARISIVTASVPHQATAAAVHHQPYRLNGEAAACDWVQHVELDAARRMAHEDAGEPLKVLVLYGSLRQRSYSKLLAYEFSRCAQSQMSYEVAP